MKLLTYTCHAPECCEHAMFYCYCAKVPQYFCRMHIEGHILAGSSHDIKRLYRDLTRNDEERLKLLNEKVRTAKLSFAASIEKKVDTLIERIMEDARGKLEQFNRKADLITQFSDACVGSKRWPHHPEDEETREYIDLANSLNSDFLRTIADSRENETIYFFNGPSTILVEMNVKFTKALSIPLKGAPHPLSSLGSLCALNHSYLFYYGGYNGDYKSTSCLINVKTGLCEQLPELHPPRKSAGLCAMNSWVFVFGGLGKSGLLNDAHIFSMTHKSWTKLPDLPFSSTQNIAISVYEVVLVTGCWADGLYSYSFSTNSYEKLLSLPQKRPKLLLKDDSAVYLLCDYNKTIYKSSVHDLHVWEIKGTFTENITISSTPVKFNNSFHFTGLLDKLYKFDLSSLELTSSTISIPRII